MRIHHCAAAAAAARRYHGGSSISPCKLCPGRRLPACTNDKVCFLIKNLPPARRYWWWKDRHLAWQPLSNTRQRDVLFVMWNAFSILSRRSCINITAHQAMFNRSKERHATTPFSIHHYVSEIVCHDDLWQLCVKINAAHAKISY